jgi:hypothetical protein
MIRVAICSPVLVVFLFTSQATAHLVFKKEISAKYANMNVTCNACHVDGKAKTERNDFGKLFAKELKDHDISATYKSKKGAERKEFEKEVMIPEFKKALDKIKARKPKDQEKTYDQLIKAGEIKGITAKSENNQPDNKQDE